MKKIVLAVVAVLCAAQAQAQYVPGTLSVKPMVGAVNSTYIGMKESPKSIWGFVGGAEVDYQLSDMFGLSLGALYSQHAAWREHRSHERWQHQKDCDEVITLIFKKYTA